MELTPELHDLLRQGAEKDGVGHTAALWLVEQNPGLLAVLADKGLIFRDFVTENPEDFEVTARVNYPLALDVLPRHSSPGEDRRVVKIAAALAGDTGGFNPGDVRTLEDDRLVCAALHAIAWAARGRDFADSLGLLTSAETAGDAPDELTPLRERVAELEKDAAKLRALRAYGVDNWDGYSDAMSSLDGED
jgi:hypothetical protein